MHGLLLGAALAELADGPGGGADELVGGTVDDC